VLRSPRRLCRRLGWHRAAVLLWLVISVGLIAVALALSNHGPGECVQPWGTACARQAPAHVVRPPSSRGAVAIWAELGDAVRHPPGMTSPCPHHTKSAALVRARDPHAARDILTPDRYADIEVRGWQFSGRAS
jgi:hypothetical protein